jgi:hypothetical protein
VQSAQLKTMLGDMAGSLELSTRALPLARTKDEVCQIRALSKIIFFCACRPKRFSTSRS